MSTSSIKIIGVGNEFRGDDGAGVVVARALQAYAMPGVTVHEATGEGSALMEAWKDADFVFLVDAVRAQSWPGTVYRIDAREERLPTDFFHYSTHAFSVAEAVELARTLALLPPQLIVYGIEGATYEHGAERSPAVTQAIDHVIMRIRKEIDALVGVGSF